MGCALVWRESGSIAARDWLLYALLAFLLLATALLSATARRPTGAALIAIGGLLALAGWAALSASWSPLPTLARDEALLTLFYAAVVAVPALTLRSPADRLAALALVALATAGLALATILSLRLGADPLAAYHGGRLWSPVTYGNAQAAVFLVGFWPAVAVASRRDGSLALRTLGAGGAGLLLAGWLLTQSRGGGIALALSAIVIFAVCPARLRLVLPTAIAAVPAYLAFDALVAPYRAWPDEVLLEAIRHAAGVALAVGAVAAAAGLVYAAADRRIDLGDRTRRRVGLAAAVAFAAFAVAGAAAFVSSVGSPVRFAADQWDAFKQYPDELPEGSRFLNPGSNRYDFWRVAVAEFREHPVAGIGSRGFGAAYLQHRRSGETPARAHSLPLEMLAENGIVGFSLLAVALGAPLAAALRRRHRVPAAAVLGAGAYWIVHASGDWTWTFPAAAVPFFVLLGIASAGTRRRPLAARPAAAAGIAALAVALLLLAPALLSSRLTVRAVQVGTADVRGDLVWARRLDPLSVEPLLAQAELARSPGEAVAALERAAEKEPRSVRVQYLLALAYLEAGRAADARERLLVADDLFPRNETIRQALERTQQP